MLDSTPQAGSQRAFDPCSHRMRQPVGRPRLATAGMSRLSTIEYFSPSWTAFQSDRGQCAAGGGQTGHTHGDDRCDPLCRPDRRRRGIDRRNRQRHRAACDKSDPGTAGEMSSLSTCSFARPPCDGALDTRRHSIRARPDRGRYFINVSPATHMRRPYGGTPRGKLAASRSPSNIATRRPSPGPAGKRPVHNPPSAQFQQERLVTDNLATLQHQGSRTLPSHPAGTHLLHADRVPEPSRQAMKPTIQAK